MKQTGSLFKIIKHSYESFKQFVDWFKVALKLVVNPNQFIAYRVFIKGLMHNLIIYNKLSLSNLVVGRIEKYLFAQPIISRFLKLEAMKDSCPFSNQENVR